MSVRADWEPDWHPLEQNLQRAGIPADACAAFMWMYRTDGLEFYKHIETRRYLILASDSACYSYDAAGLVRVPFLPAYLWVCDTSQNGPMPLVKEAGHESRHA